MDVVAVETVSSRSEEEQAALRRTADPGRHDTAPVRACRRATPLRVSVTDREPGYPLEMLINAAGRARREREPDSTCPNRGLGRVSRVTGSVHGSTRAMRDTGRVLPA